MWILLAFGTAFFDAFRAVISKVTLKKVDELTVIWSNCFFSAVFLIPAIFFIPEIKQEFYSGLLISGVLNVVALILYMKSIKLSDISVVIPLATISPLFMLITSPIIVGEFPKPVGLLGMLFIVLGAYLLNFNKTNKDLFAPFKALVNQPGPKYMLIVVIIWSVSSNFDKVGIKGSSPFFYAFAIQFFISILILIIMLIRKSFSTKMISQNFKPLIGIGISSAILILFYSLAVSMTLVAYVISIKRTNSILSVLFGKYIFKEGNIRERLFASILMFIGILLITFA